MITKYILGIILSIFLLFRSWSSTLAIDNEQNSNKFGIHIINPSDLTKAAELVNSNGGDWGWVTMVIQENDRNIDKWQAFFDHCRELHLIPLIRAATYAKGDVWSKPKLEQVDSWYNFLNTLNWPTSDRYIVVYNEPNHDKEWGGDANPKEYAQILDRFITIFSQNPKFKVINAGMDLAAPNGNTTYEAFRFLREINFEVPGIFNRLSAWSSHSYPNHGFLGKPTENKKTSIRGYQFELSLLKNELGVTRDLPVFITETGWPYENAKCKVQSSKSRKLICTNKYYSPEKAAEYIISAYENYWLKDDRVMAVTPFTLNYPYPPFLEFSWLDVEGNPSPQYSLVAKLPKISWQPPQENKYELEIQTAPDFMPANNKYYGHVNIKNIGESILFEKGRPIFLDASSSAKLEVSQIIVNKKLKPGEMANFDYTIYSSSASGTFYYGWGDAKQTVRVLPDSIITSVRYSLWQKVILKLSNLLH